MYICYQATAISTDATDRDYDVYQSLVREYPRIAWPHQGGCRKKISTKKVFYEGWKRELFKTRKTPRNRSSLFMTRHQLDRWLCGLLLHQNLNTSPEGKIWCQNKSEFSTLIKHILKQNVHCFPPYVLAERSPKPTMSSGWTTSPGYMQRNCRPSKYPTGESACGLDMLHWDMTGQQ